MPIARVRLQRRVHNTRLWVSKLHSDSSIWISNGSKLPSIPIQKELARSTLSSFEAELLGMRVFFG